MMIYFSSSRTSRIIRIIMMVIVMVYNYDLFFIIEEFHNQTKCYSAYSRITCSISNQSARSSYKLETFVHL